MDIKNFKNEYAVLSLERRRNYANRLMNELTKMINQEYKNDGDSSTFRYEFLPILLDLEAEDFFGTEGFDA